MNETQSHGDIKIINHTIYIMFKFIKQIRYELSHYKYKWDIEYFKEWMLDHFIYHFETSCYGHIGSFFPKGCYVDTEFKNKINHSWWFDCQCTDNIKAFQRLNK